ncbi:MAG: hypothetical protein KF819_32895 [Labilithrix sp.]|nr:hypothetical protein [Labilithrix sp.]
MSLHESDVYRVPGREAEPEPIPPPSGRRLVSPLGWGAAAITAIVGPLLVFNLLFDPDAGNGHRHARFVPAIETFEDVTMLVLLATTVVAVVVLVRRVVPIWGGLGRWARGFYVLAVVVLQALAIAGGEIAIFASRGGLHLFEPTLQGTTALPDGRSAHVYASGLFGTTYDVYVADRFAIVMHKRLSVSRGAHEKVVPTVRVRADGDLELVDAAGRALESQGFTLPLFGIGGC